jgi:hypothetical protein
MVGMSWKRICRSWSIDCVLISNVFCNSWTLTRYFFASLISRLERAITSGLSARGGSATKVGNAWRVKWADGSESAQVCFDARTADENPELEWVTMEDPRARAIISELPRFVAGQPLPVIRVTGLPDSVRGIWSLWEISLAAEGLSRKRFLPVFVNEEGRPLSWEDQRRRVEQAASKPRRAGNQPPTAQT